MGAFFLRSEREEKKEKAFFTEEKRFGPPMCRKKGKRGAHGIVGEGERGGGAIPERKQQTTTRGGKEKKKKGFYSLHLQEKKRKFPCSQKTRDAFRRPRKRKNP